MKNKWATIIIIIFIIVIVIILKVKPAEKIVSTTLPVSQTPAHTTPKPTPKTFKFDRNTDLEMELESVNPQVLDSDFE